MLLHRGEVGSLKQSVTVEWTIKDIFSYTKANEAIKGSQFSAFDCRWQLGILFYGATGTKPFRWLSICLYKKDLENPKNMKIRFNIRKVDGTFEKEYSNERCMFDEKFRVCFRRKMFNISELQRRKSELAPTDDLTITCTLTDNDSLQSISRLITLSKDLKQMLVSKKECDITLKVQGKEFSSHKSVLACRCPVFEFNSDMKEKNTGIVDIVDCNPNAFRHFLVYIYSGNFITSSSGVFELYKIAHKYMVAKLMTECVAYMMRNLSVENVLDVAVFAHQFDERELKDKVQDFFNENFSDIDSSKWNSFSKDNHTLSNELLINKYKIYEDTEEIMN